MRFAISLLSILAVASIIGTVLKQAEPYSNYLIQLGRSGSRCLKSWACTTSITPPGFCSS